MCLETSKWICDNGGGGGGVVKTFWATSFVGVAQLQQSDL